MKLWVCKVPKSQKWHPSVVDTNVMCLLNQLATFCMSSPVIIVTVGEDSCFAPTRAFSQSCVEAYESTDAAEGFCNQVCKKLLKK